MKESQDGEDIIHRIQPYPATFQSYKALHTEDLILCCDAASLRFSNPKPMFNLWDESSVIIVNKSATFSVKLLLDWPSSVVYHGYFHMSRTQKAIRGPSIPPGGTKAFHLGET